MVADHYGDDISNTEKFTECFDIGEKFFGGNIFWKCTKNPKL